MTVCKHISAPDQGTYVHLVTTPKGTLLYDYNFEVFLVVQGFSRLHDYKCVWDIKTQYATQNFQKAYGRIYDI